ncbi:MAG TPA: hypothetical protein VGO93_02620 [Candidatus Xenobia bacterium]|jgi:hypothetical protein
MLKRFILLALLLTQVALAAPKTYHDEANGYQITYEGSGINWTPSRAGDEMWNIEYVNGDAYYNLHMAISPTTKSDPKDVCQDMCWKISQTAKSITTVSEVKVLSGLYGFTFDSVKDAQDDHGRWGSVKCKSCGYVVLNQPRHKAYMFFATTYPEQFAVMKPRWEKIISTLRFDP